MFNTYIYGTPLGFDFFEDTASLKDYFKGLYISSRKGRRLMVNRRDNGETFYNYLRYGLAENEGRPNSFFGMSISIDNNEYAYDFKEIFDWFDYLFGKLVDRGVLFFVNAGNVIQYKVPKFKDSSNEIQWLKNNIPNLFTKAQGIKLLEFDSSFSSSSSGQIRCFNDDTSMAVIVDAFKKYRWVAISPNFKPEEESIEIDLYGIDTQLNRYNQQLVPIAISPKRENLDILDSIESDCYNMSLLIQKYLSTEHDENEQKECNKLLERAKDIVSNTRAIISKIKNADIQQDGSERPVSFRICKKCGRQLPLLNFDSQNSPYCHGCTLELEKDHIHKDQKHEKKKCIKCGIEKNVSEFPNNSLICYDCAKSKTILDYINLKVIAIAVIAFLIVGISLYLIFGGKTYGDSIDSTGDVVALSEYEPSSNLVNDSIFDSQIRDAEFLSAYDYIKGKDDENKYLNLLNLSIQSYLWNLIDSPGKAAGVDGDLNTFFITNYRLVVEVLHIDKQDWINCANAYERLMYLIKRPSLNQIQRDEAYRLIEKLPMYPESIRQTFIGRIENMPTDEVVKDGADSGGKEKDKLKDSLESPYLVIINQKGEKKSITSTSGYDYPDGSKVTISSNVKLKISGNGSEKGNVKINKKGTKVTINVKAGKKVIVSAGDLQVTITGTTIFRKL